MLRWSRYLALGGEGGDANNVSAPQLIAVIVSAAKLGPYFL